MSKIEERIEAQRKKIEQEKARLQQLQSRAKGEERKKDTRRKIVAGALVLSAKDERIAQWLKDQIAGLPDRDRELFKGLI